MFIDGCGSYQAAKAGGTRSGLRKVLAGPKRMVGEKSLIDWRASATVLIATIVDTGYGCSGLLRVALNTLLGNSGLDSRLGV